MQLVKVFNIHNRYINMQIYIYFYRNRNIYTCARARFTWSLLCVSLLKKILDQSEQVKKEKIKYSPTIKSPSASTSFYPVRNDSRNTAGKKKKNSRICISFYFSVRSFEMSFYRGTADHVTARSCPRGKSPRQWPRGWHTGAHTRRCRSRFARSLAKRVHCPACAPW